MRVSEKAHNSSSILFNILLMDNVCSLCVFVYFFFVSFLLSFCVNQIKLPLRLKMNFRCLKDLKLLT